MSLTITPSLWVLHLLAREFKITERIQVQTGYTQANYPDPPGDAHQRATAYEDKAKLEQYREHEAAQRTEIQPCSKY